MSTQVGSVWKDRAFVVPGDSPTLETGHDLSHPSFPIPFPSLPSIGGEGKGIEGMDREEGIMPSGAHGSLNQAVIARVVERTSREAARRATDRLKERLAQEVRASGRVQTGAMADRWNDAEVAARTAHGTAFRVWSPQFYTPFQNDGTRGSRARPGHALRFKIGGRVVFVKSTRGVPAAHFLERARDGMRTRDWLP